MNWSSYSTEWSMPQTDLQRPEVQSRFDEGQGQSQGQGTLIKDLSGGSIKEAKGKKEREFAKAKTNANKGHQPKEQEAQPSPWLDISDYTNTNDLIYIVLAVLFVDVAVIFLARYFPEIFGCSLNKWYDTFGLCAVLADVGIIVIGFIISRFLYTKFVEPEVEWSPIYFLGILVGVQALHDILFYLGIIKQLPRGHNSMIDVFKDYSEGGAKILVGDAGLMVSSALVAMLLKGQDSFVNTSFGTLVLYALSYILFTKPVNITC
jgi:hypothetical protein